MDSIVLNDKQMPIDWLCGATWSGKVISGDLKCLLVVSEEDFELLYKSKDPKNDYKDDEHLMDYPIRYAYLLDMGYNKAGAPYAGNAIFLHCWKDENTPTGGCVAISEENMVRVLTTITPGTTVTIY